MFNSSLNEINQLIQNKSDTDYRYNIPVFTELIYEFLGHRKIRVNNIFADTPIKYIIKGEIKETDDAGKIIENFISDVNYDIENMKEPHKRFNLKELYNKNIYIASTNQPLLDELQNFRISNSNENNTNDLRLKYKHICIRSTIFNRGSIMICFN